jgi:hypothetical protein
MHQLHGLAFLIGLAVLHVIDTRSLTMARGDAIQDQLCRPGCMIHKGLTLDIAGGNAIQDQLCRPGCMILKGLTLDIAGGRLVEKVGKLDFCVSLGLKYAPL